MPTTHRVPIDGRQLAGWEELHRLFASKFGFPAYYGRNLDAWIDCMTHLVDESCVLELNTGDVLVIELENGRDLKVNKPELLEFIFEGAAFVNKRLHWSRLNQQPGEYLDAIAISADV